MELTLALVSCVTSVPSGFIEKIWDVVVVTCFVLTVTGESNTMR